MGDATADDGGDELLIGAAGSEFVARTLMSTSQPQDAITTIQRKGALPNSRYGDESPPQAARSARSARSA